MAFQKYYLAWQMSVNLNFSFLLSAEEGPTASYTDAVSSKQEAEVWEAC